jgi:two-component SAPR family response regulator
MDKNYKVLIVEDDAMTLSLLCKMVEAIGGYEVIPCQSAKKAIEVLSDSHNNWRPDIILSDFMMADGDGIDLLNNVRSKYGNDVPFVFITCANRDLFGYLISNDTNIDIIPKPLMLVKLKKILNKLNPHLESNLNYREKDAK